jgi:hypothetical protein
MPIQAVGPEFYRTHQDQLYLAMPRTVSQKAILTTDKH